MKLFDALKAEPGMFVNFNHAVLIWDENRDAYAIASRKGMGYLAGKDLTEDEIVRQFMKVGRKQNRAKNEPKD